MDSSSAMPLGNLTAVKAIKVHGKVKAAFADVFDIDLSTVSCVTASNNFEEFVKSEVSEQTLEDYFRDKYVSTLNSLVNV